MTTRSPHGSRKANLPLLISCGLPRLNPGVRGEDLTSQLSWAAASLLAIHVCPVYLVDEFSPCVLWPFMIGLMVVLLMLFVKVVSMVLLLVFLLWGVDAILWDGYRI